MIIKDFLKISCSLLTVLLRVLKRLGLVYTGDPSRDSLFSGDFDHSGDSLLSCLPHQTLYLEVPNCIYTVWKCDGFPDCDDRSDEIRCANGAQNCQQKACNEVYLSLPGNCLVCEGNDLLNAGILYAMQQLKHFKGIVSNGPMNLTPNQSFKDAFAEFVWIYMSLLSYGWLNDNMIAQMSPFAFPPSLVYLNLNNNRISQIPSNVFPPNLENLYMAYNNVTRIQPFALPSGLLVLSLSHNYISEIPPRVLPSNLSWLYLDNNVISEISPNVFPSSLHWLDLSNNRISKIFSGKFPENVHFISLTGNRIHDIPRNVLPKDVRRLNLLGNPIFEIEEDAFSNCTSMSKLLTSHYGICCIYANGYTNFSAPPSPFNTCNEMFPNNVLRVTLWSGAS